MELSANSFDRLTRLKELSEAGSYTEVMKDALRLYEYVVEEESKGAKFLLESPDGKISQIKIFT
jgi:hypothetical protein